MKQTQLRIEHLQHLRDKELGSRLEELETDLVEKEKAANKVESATKVVRDNIKQEDKKKAQTVKGMKSDQKHLTEKTKIADGLQETYDKLREENDRYGPSNLTFCHFYHLYLSVFFKTGALQLTRRPRPELRPSLSESSATRTARRRHCRARQDYKSL